MVSENFLLTTSLSISPISFSRRGIKARGNLFFQPSGDSSSSPCLYSGWSPTNWAFSTRPIKYHWQKKPKNKKNNLFSYSPSKGNEISCRWHSKIRCRLNSTTTKNWLSFYFFRQVEKESSSFNINKRNRPLEFPKELNGKIMKDKSDENTGFTSLCDLLLALLSTCVPTCL